MSELTTKNKKFFCYICSSRSLRIKWAAVAQRHMGKKKNNHENFFTHNHQIK